MTKNYSQHEINQILISKKLNEFYFAIIENRGELLTNEEFDKLIKRTDVVYNDVSKEEIESTVDDLANVNDGLKEFKSDFMRLIYSCSQIRQGAILTMIDDEVYNMAEDNFINLKEYKIIHYDNFTNYYNEVNARLRFITPAENPQLQVESVLLDTDDQSPNDAYFNAHLHQEENDDLTSAFLEEVKGKAYTLSKK